jgi:hypothetical protein
VVFFIIRSGKIYQYGENLKLFFFVQHWVVISCHCWWLALSAHLAAVAHVAGSDGYLLGYLLLKEIQ